MTISVVNIFKSTLTQIVANRRFRGALVPSMCYNSGYIVQVTQNVTISDEDKKYDYYML